MTKQDNLHVSQKDILETQCPFCSMQCKLAVMKDTANKYKVIGVNNPTTEGRICIKGRYAHEHSFDSERITSPLLKVDGTFQPISWIEAYSYMKEKVVELHREAGQHSIGVYGSGSISNEEAYLLGKFARVALKTKYIDYNGRLCMSAAASAAMQTFGLDRGFTFSLSEIPFTNCILLVGANIAESQPTIMPYFQRAKENGATIIYVDPRQTPTSKLATIHLQIKPGSDAALANGMLKVIVEEGLVNESFIKEHVSHYHELKEHLATITMNEVCEMTDITEAQIYKVATLFASSVSGMLFTARGIEQQTDGSKAVRNFLNLLLVTGKIGKEFSGYGAITGQGNGQGAREHGQKADQLPGYRSIENPIHRREIASVWQIAEEELPRKGVSAYEMFEKMETGEIKGLFLMCSNPVVSSPNANFVKAALQKLTFFVAIDLFLSETAKMADLVLPSTSFLEKEGTFTNVEGRVTLREASMPIVGECKHDWQIICEIAEQLGYGKYFRFTSAEEIFDELRNASRGGLADYYGITYERIKEHQGLLWPCPKLDHPGTARLYEDGFAHPDKKAKLVVVPNRSAVLKEEANVEYPLYLTTGRVMSHYQTGVLTSKSRQLNMRATESFVEIHPQTAEMFGISHQSPVLVKSKRGSIVVKAKVTERIRPDTVFIPFHWEEEQNVNKLVTSELDPDCRMPGLKRTAVRVHPI